MTEPNLKYKFQIKMKFYNTSLDFAMINFQVSYNVGGI